MFKRHFAKCICHNLTRLIVVKAGYCEQGNEAKKRLAKPPKPSFKKPQSPIRKRSIKKQSEDRIYSKKKAAYLKLHPNCEANIPGICSKQPADQVHHKKGKVGKLYTDERYFLATEFNCHRWITDHPKEAIELGFSEPRLTKKA